MVTSSSALMWTLTIKEIEFHNQVLGKIKSACFCTHLQWRMCVWGINELYSKVTLLNQFFSNFLLFLHTQGWFTEAGSTDLHQQRSSNETGWSPSFIVSLIVLIGIRFSTEKTSCSCGLACVSSVIASCAWTCPISCWVPCLFTNNGLLTVTFVCVCVCVCGGWILRSLSAWWVTNC